MHAKEQRLKQLLEGEKQYVVPLYQRTYAWQRPQLQQLWEDVLRQADEIDANGDAPGHFLGSLVLASTPAVAGGASRWLVVDGQQRLTSLSLALCALRDHVREESPKDADRIHRQFLINEYQEGTDRLKLLPTQDDRASFEAIVDGDPGEASGNIGEAYRTLRELIMGADDPDDERDMLRVEQALVNRLDLVAITTDNDDNVHRIFQSLNNTGMQLTQGDLLRNHYFMLLPTSADRVYAQIWRPMEKALGPANLETLAFLDLLLSGYEKASRGDTYRLQAERIAAFESDEAAVEADIVRLAERARALAPVLEPSAAPSPAIREGLDRLTAWGGEATQVVMLAAMERFHAGSMTEAEVARVSLLCEAYLVRRMLTGRSAAGIKRILPEAARSVLTADDAPHTLHAYLSAPRRGWATDKVVREQIQTRNFYWTGKASQRLFVLRRVEESFSHKEPVDWATARPQVEHIMPQTLTEEWLPALVDPADPLLPPSDVHAQWVHRLGNLTLTSYNSELSNAPYSVKRERYRGSHFEMTRRTAVEESWGPEQIARRADRLVDRIIEIWPAPLNEETQATDPWRQVRQILVALPEGSWTTYGDIAAVTGHHPVALGQFLGGSVVPNAWRVLSAPGRIAEGFRWAEPRDETPREILESEGVHFDDKGIADQAARFEPADIAQLLGMDAGVGEVPEQGTAGAAEDEEGFWNAVEERHGGWIVAGLRAAAAQWTSLGGTLQYSGDPQMAMYPVLADCTDRPWMLGVFPGGNGAVEVPFQYLKTRPPFDDSTVRTELLERLNAVPGIDLPKVKLGLRPRFPLAVLADEASARELFEVMRWFVETARS